MTSSANNMPKFSGAYQFHCEAAFDGTPDNCAVMDTVGSVLGSADGTEGTFPALAFPW